LAERFGHEYDRGDGVWANDREAHVLARCSLTEREEILDCPDVPELNSRGALDACPATYAAWFPDGG